jgi:glycosyltransferase involved in cell wall biosynthesis
MVSTYVPKFTYIIPFRYSQDRILPLKRITEWLSGFQNVEIIIVEQDKHSKIDFMNFKATHIFVESELPFNKSWAYNVGLKRASSSVIVFGEADFLMNPMELIECLKVLDNFDCVIPTDKIMNLSQRDSMMDTASLLKMKNFLPKLNTLDGISIFKKDAINKIGGWNEDMIGLSHENEFNDLKIKHLLKFKQMEYGGYHLYHYPTTVIPQLKERNKQILDVYKNDPKLLTQHIQQISPKIGTKNRFIGINN